jgi:polyphosphate kinase
MFPLEDERARERALSILETGLADTTNGHQMQPDGSFLPPQGGKRGKRSQEEFHARAKQQAENNDTGNQKVFEVRRRPPTG